MSPWDGPSTMRTLRLDRNTADRLLAGLVAPEDAPPGYADLARLVAAASAPPAAAELTRMDKDVDAAAALRTVAPALTAARRGPWRARSRVARVRTVALVAAGTVVATSGLAAAGVLPGPVQEAVSDVLSYVGITVPGAEDDRESGDSPTPHPPSASPAAVGPREPEVDTPPPPTPRRGGDDGSVDKPGGAGAAETSDDDKPGNGPPANTPGDGPPAAPGNGPPEDTPGNGPPEDTPGNGPPEDTPGNGPPADSGGRG